jgi:hypothetical protein
MLSLFGKLSANALYLFTVLFYSERFNQKASAIITISNIVFIAPVVVFYRQLKVKAIAHIVKARSLKQISNLNIYI